MYTIHTVLCRLQTRVLYVKRFLSDLYKSQLSHPCGAWGWGSGTRTPWPATPLSRTQ